jgi:hypothetical protein
VGGGRRRYRWACPAVDLPIGSPRRGLRVSTFCPGTGGRVPGTGLGGGAKAARRAALPAALPMSEWDSRAG